MPLNNSELMGGFLKRTPESQKRKQEAPVVVSAPEPATPAEPTMADKALAMIFHSFATSGAKERQETFQTADDGRVFAWAKDLIEEATAVVDPDAKSV